MIAYSDQCPFTYYWVSRLQEAALQHDIPLKVIHIDSREAAQNAASPVTNFTLYKDGDFVSHEIQSEKKFLALAGIKA